MFNKLKRSISLKSRIEKINRFYSFFPKQVNVLDAGVSNIAKHKRKPLANFFLKNFRFPSKYYTGLAIDDVSGLITEYPDKVFVRYDGNVFPFHDNEFDVVFSNAVIEHVGSFDDQVFFLNEMLRVGKTVFFTTPNKYFPIETHTGIILLHWLDGVFFSWCRIRNVSYRKSNLNLISRRDLNKILLNSSAKTFEIYEYKILNMTMTFTIVCKRDV